MLDNQKEFQETLHQVLNTKVRAESKQEMVMQSILKKYDKNNEMDFQEMLRKSIKLTYEDKIRKDFKPQLNKNDVKKDNTKDNLDIAKQVRTGEDLNIITNNLDDKTTDEVIEENEEKSVSSGENLTRKEEALKYMYTVALEEYYKLKEDLYKIQIREGNIAVDDENYIKLLRYENYLRKCDTMFKLNTGKYISNQDEEILKKENKYAYEAAKSERTIANDHENAINEIDRLNAEIENKADEIMELNYNAKNGNVKDYETKLELLEKQYVELNVKMRMLKPNIFELYRQEEEKKEQEEVTARVVGTKYGEDKDKYVMKENVVRLDRKTDNREKSSGHDIVNEKIELDNTNIELAKSYIDAAEVALNKDDLSGAKHMVNKAKEMVGKKQVDDIASNKKTNFKTMLENSISLENNVKINKLENSQYEISQYEISQTDKIDNHLSKVLNNDVHLSPVQDECKTKVNTPDERLKKDLIRLERQEIEKEKNEIDKEKNNEKIR